MKIFLISITVVSSVLMILVILLQQGKGADLGAAFGRGAQGGLFEASGKATFLSRVTSVLAVVFLMSSLALSLLIGGEDGVLRELETSAPAAELAAPDDAADEEAIPLAAEDDAGESESDSASENENAEATPSAADDIPAN